MKKLIFSKITRALGLTLAFLIINNLNAQPTLRKGFSLESKYFNNGPTSDWIFAIAMDPDCQHFITGGYVLQPRNIGDNIPFIKVAMISKVDPESKAIVWQTEVNLTHLASMNDSEDETQASVENMKIINNEIIFTGTETVRENSSSVRHCLFGRLDLDGNILQAEWLDYGSNGARGNGITALSDGGSMIAGNVNPNDPNNVISSLIKLKADGSVDFVFQGIEGTSFENVIEIIGTTSSVKFVAIGFLLKNGDKDDPDVYIVGIKSDGTIAWSKSFDEMDVIMSNNYSDINSMNEKLEDCNGTSDYANSNRELGYDIIQDNDKLYFTAEFDYFAGYNQFKNNGANWGNCIDDDRLDYDLVLGKMDLNSGSIDFVKNLERFRGDDFKPRILKQGNKLTIMGEIITPASGNDPRIGNGALVITDLSGNAITKEFLVSGEVDCSFASTEDCDGNVIVAGNTDENEDDYFFARFINSCQNTLSYSGNDVVANTEINNTQYWHSSRKVKATVIINSGGHLVIDQNAIIQFASSWEIVDYSVLAKNNSNTEVPRIVVMNGGTLTIDQASLKGLYACDQDWMWDGIEVRNGGHVIMTNEASILDAKIGILVDQGSYNIDGNFNSTESNGGGTVNASGDSKFENCRRDVHFARSSALNSSAFTNTHFLCTDGLKDIQYKAVYTSNQNPPSTSIIQLGTKEFVTVHEIKGITFSNSEWSNTRSTSFPAELRGIGISSYDADYQVSSESSFKDLNYGIQALNATNSTRFVRISGSNQFLRNQIGVRIVGGSLHEIKSGNAFELNPSSFVYNQFFSKNPIIGVSNSGSSKTDVIENTFDGVSSFSTSDPLKYGFITDNSNSKSFHLKNNFTKLFMGEQMQRDNTGMQLYCNEHTLFKNSWSAYGKMSNQGLCGAQLGNLTPDDKFLVPCQSNSFSHINSSASFTYYEYSGFTGNPDPSCVTNAVTIGTNCDGTEADGCDFIPPDLTSGNVNSYRTQVDGMDDGAFRDVIVNSLLRYYYTHGMSEDAEDLISGLSGDNYKLDYALLLTNSGNYSQADSVINSIPNSSDEKSDMEVFMHIIISAKHYSVPLNQLSQTAIDTLIGIADHRSLGGYAAQALLMAYYNQEYLIPIETNNGIGYRSRSNLESKVASNCTLIFTPGVVNDQFVASILLVDPIADANLILYNTDGKELFSAKLKDAKTEIGINSELWPQGLFYGIVTSNGEVILHTKGMKK